MPRFFAMTSRGLTETLEQELKELGFTDLLKGPGGIYFDSNWAGCYRANLRLRSATRVLLPILDFPAYKPEDLYHNILKHDYTKYIAANGTVAVDASVRDSVFTDSRFVAMKIKDAVVDQFREKFGERPNVDKKDPDLRIHARAVKNNFSVSIDTSGDALFKRGYRTGMVEAPLKEHVAAGLLKAIGYTGDVPLLDPMCGSGTFLIEGALIALGMAPGTLRHRFAFQNLKGFNEADWDAELSAAMEGEREELPFKFYGYDINRDAVLISQDNVKKAGLSELIEIQRQAMETLEPPCEKGIIVVNPPYGERLGTEGELIETYKNLAFTLKSRFKGWTCWVLSGNPELSKAMHLKAERRIPVFNGPIECRFLRYDMF